MFNGILRQDAILYVNNQYVITYGSGRFLEYRTDTWVLGELRRLLGNTLEIINVSRPLFSSNYVITLIPQQNIMISEALGLLNAAWVQMGYGAADFIIAEDQTAGSSSPGGLPGALQQTGSAIGSTAGNMLKPLTPFVIIGLIAYITLNVLKIEVRR